MSSALGTLSPTLLSTRTVGASQAGAKFAADLANDAQVPEDPKALGADLAGCQGRSMPGGGNWQRGCEAGCEEVKKSVGLCQGHVIGKTGALLDCWPRL